MSKKKKLLLVLMALFVLVLNIAVLMHQSPRGGLVDLTVTMRADVTETLQVYYSPNENFQEEASNTANYKDEYENGTMGEADEVTFPVDTSAGYFRVDLGTQPGTYEFYHLTVSYRNTTYEIPLETVETARKYNKPIIVMEPVRGGMLASPSSDEVRRILDDASEKAGQSGASYASYALRYASQLDGVLCTLSGMSTTAQMKENIQTFSGPVLTAEQLDAVHQAALKLRADIIVPCTGCNYCYECPAEIKIPKIFSWYNEAAAKGFHWIWGSLSKQYEELGNTGKDCLQCGNCQSHCPQKIQIIDLLQQIERKYEELKEAGE